MIRRKNRTTNPRERLRKRSLEPPSVMLRTSPRRLPVDKSEAVVAEASGEMMPVCVEAVPPSESVDWRSRHISRDMMRGIIYRFSPMLMGI